MKRILIPNPNSDPANVKRALDAGVDVCKQTGAKQLTLITPRKGTFESNYGDVLGRDFARRLQKDGTQSYAGIQVRLESIDTLRFSAGETLVAIHITERDMPKVDSLTGMKCLIYLPWNQPDGEAYERKWKLSSGVAEEESTKSNLHPAVLQELLALTASLNLANNFDDDREKTKAIEMFKRFKDKGLNFSAVEMESWAARNNWRQDNARKLRTLAERYGG